MSNLKIFCVDCTLRTQPELSELGSIWTLVKGLYSAQGHQIEQVRLADLRLLSGPGHGDAFPEVLNQIVGADILIIGTPVIAGQYSSLCQKLIERLQSTYHEGRDLSTGHYPLFGTVLGILLSGEGDGAQVCTATLAHQLNQLGCFIAPHCSAYWQEKIEMHYFDRLLLVERTPSEVDRDTRLLVQNTVALAERLRCSRSESLSPFAGKEIYSNVKADLKLARIEGLEILSAESEGKGIDRRLIGMRTWILMEEGRRRGFSFKVINIRDAVFKAIRGDRGFVFETYPGFIRFRAEFEDYDKEKSKALKLIKMSSKGLPIPVDYGCFSNVSDIPIDQLQFPLVVKPDGGSLSENVFTNLNSVESLQRAAFQIELLGKPIKVESYVPGQNYRILVIAGQYAGCVERRPANVVGDGQHTIWELFHLRNQEPGRGNRYAIHTTIHQLVFDQTSRLLLEEAGYTLDTVLPQGKMFFLQKKIVASLGADYVDLTDRCHPNTVDLCLEFAQQFSIPTIGLDLITEDISSPLKQTGGAFNEYNFLPYLDIHENCNMGQQRSVTSILWEHIEAHSNEILTPSFDPF